MSAAVNPAALASGAAGDRGKRERGLWGTDPLPHLELGWRAEVARWKQAAAVGESCGGGAREAREGAGGGGRSCEAMATPRTSLYSRGMAVARRWRGGPRRWRSDGFGGALMALDGSWCRDAASGGGEGVEAVVGHMEVGRELCSPRARAPRRRRCAVRRGEARGPRARAWTCRGAARAYGRR